MKIVQWLLIPAMGLGLFAADAGAKTYYLPDYQDQELPFSTKRANTIPGGGTVTPSCSSDYKYTASDCPTSKYTLGSSCGGKYKSCTCRSDIYPASSTTSGCSAGYVVDASASCTDKPSGDTKYACKDDACYGMILIIDCEGEDRFCAPSSKSGCSEYCETYYCLDKCDYLQRYERYEGAVAYCDQGCAPGKEIEECPSLCQAGGCKTCSPCSADFDLATKPGANYTYEECTGCDDVVMYKITGCAVNYEYWCDVPNCVDLGYKLDASCSSNQMTVRCPYSSAYAVCL